MKISKAFFLSCILSFAAYTAPALSAEPIRAAIDPTFPPMEYIENGKRVGFDIDFANALAHEMGREFQFNDIDFKGMIPSVLSGRNDIVLSAIYITPERQKVVDFTDPYFSAGLVVLVKKGDTSINSPSDLNGKRVAIQVGTKSVALLRDKFPQVNRIEVEKNEEMFNSLESGRADAVVTGRPAALLYAQKRGTTRVLPAPLTREDYGIAVSKRSPEILSDLNKAIAAIRADGTYDRLTRKWFGDNEH